MRVRRHERVHHGSNDAAAGVAMPDVLAVLRALGVAIFLWTAKDRQTLESLWKRSPDGIMSDLVEEHHRLAGAAETLTMLRRRTRAVTCGQSVRFTAGSEGTEVQHRPPDLLDQRMRRCFRQET